MKMLRRIALLKAAALLAVAAALHATSLARMSIAEMAHASSLVVRARCVSTSVRWEEGEIWTFTEFEIEESWKGAAAAGSKFTVRLLGGRLGEITSRVSGVPQFRPGEDVVLFLQPAPRGNFNVVSWEQGTFRVRHDPRSGADLITQDTASFPVFDSAHREFRSIGIARLPLSKFRAQVITAIAGDARGEK
jgi:hypothetical protein